MLASMQVTLGIPPRGADPVQRYIDGRGIVQASAGSQILPDQLFHMALLPNMALHRLFPALGFRVGQVSVFNGWDHADKMNLAMTHIRKAVAAQGPTTPLDLGRLTACVTSTNPDPQPELDRRRPTTIPPFYGRVEIWSGANAVIYPPLPPVDQPGLGVFLVYRKPQSRHTYTITVSGWTGQTAWDNYVSSRTRSFPQPLSSGSFAAVGLVPATPGFRADER